MYWCNMKVYNKLVRDKIPEIINNNNEICKTRILDNDEYIKELNIKLQEEVKEYLESGEVEELADIEEVLRAIKMFGSYRETEALQSMTETTRQAVKRMGFRNICLSENIMAERANFRTIFEQIADRDHKTAQLSTNLVQLINGIQERKEIESSECKRLSVANPET